MIYYYSEINVNVMYTSAQEREKLVDSERKFVDEKIKKIIDLKRKVIIIYSLQIFII